jgi:hypothetical protein
LCVVGSQLAPLAHNIVVLVHEMHELGITPEFWNGPQALQ